MKTFNFLTCLLLALFMGTTARSQTPAVYLSGSINGKTKVISNKGQTYNYNEPVITSLGANKDGVYALARTRSVEYTTFEHNENTFDWGQHWYQPRWNCKLTGGGVVYNNNSVYKSYTDPDWRNEDFYSSLVNYHLGFESMQIGEVNKLSVFRGTWQHQGNAGKYSARWRDEPLKKLRPMVCHITDCAYYNGKIYAVGCKEHDGSAYNMSSAHTDSYYNHRAQIWENGKDFMQVSSGDFSNSWANSITCIRDKNRNNHFYTCGYKWQPTQYLRDDFKRKASNSHKVTHMALVWRDKKEVTKLYDQKTDRSEGYPYPAKQIDKQVVINYGYGYY